MVEHRRGHVFDFLGGVLCLELANTVDDRLDKEQRKDLIPSFPLFVSWARQAALMTPEVERRLLIHARLRPAQADHVLIRARGLREAIFRIFSSHAAGRHPAAPDLAVLNKELALALRHLRVARSPQGFTWDWERGENPCERLLWPVARSAADLLTSGDLARVGICGAEGCGWLFLDTSRNHGRRWCKMESCGNRDKVRRHYQKARDQRPSGK